MNVSHTSINVAPSQSPTSERVVVMTGSILRRSVEFDPSSFTPFQKQVAASAHPPPQALTSDIATTLPPPRNQTSGHPSATRWNDMGPPLSRALLMQSLQSTTGQGSATGSRAGSVKSYGSNTGASQNSDVVAHVDTDDCGGSLMGSVTDGQSVHSQEDIRSQTETEPQYDSPIRPVSKDDAEKEPHYCDSSSEDGTHPFLKNGASGEHTNGRTSPGGTIYKGKGVRRYQGRFMNLPLQRFRQNNADDDDLLDTVLEADKVMEEQNNQQRNGGGYGYDDHWRRSLSPPMMIRKNRVRGRSPARKNGYHDNNNIANGYNSSMPNNHASSGGRRGVAGYPNNHRSRSRSRSRSFSPDARKSSTRRKRRSRPDSASPRDSCRGCSSGSGRRRHHHHHHHHQYQHHTNGRKHGSDSPLPSHSTNQHASESPRRARKRPTSQSRGRA